MDPAALAVVGVVGAIALLSRRGGFTGGQPGPGQIPGQTPQNPIGEPGSIIGTPGGPPVDTSVPQDPVTPPWYAGGLSGFAAGCSIAPPYGCIIGGAAGAIILAVRQFSNVTEEQREEFARQLGFYNLGQLYTYLRTLGAEGERLWNIGINIIGRHDVTANENWIRQVVTLLDAHGGVPTQDTLATLIPPEPGRCDAFSYWANREVCDSWGVGLGAR